MPFRMTYVGFIDKVDFDYHLGNDYNGVVVYPSLKSIQEHKPCVAECCLVEVEILLKRVVAETNHQPNRPGKRATMVHFDDGKRVEIVGTFDENQKFVPDDPQPQPILVLKFIGTFSDVSSEDQAVLVSLAEKYGVKARTSKSFRSLA